MGTDGGLVRIREDRIQLNAVFSDAHQPAIGAHRNSIWAGTDGGLVRIREDRIQLITASSGSAPERVRKLAASGDILWIGSDRGLQFINTAMVD